MKFTGYILIAFLFGATGVLLRVIAFQNVAEDGSAEEWVYDIDSIGQALFYSAPFFGLTGILTMDRMKNVSLLQWCRIPSAVGSYLTLFNCAKELSGLNNDNGVVQLIFFASGLLITILTQYAIIRKQSE